MKHLVAFSRLVMAGTLGAGTAFAHAAAPEPAASMTVFDGAAPRELEIRLRPDSRMTVFTPEGQREVAGAAAWPSRSTREGGLALSAGYRRDDMRFAIGVPGGPNVLSELRWIAPALQIRADGNWTHASGATVRGFLAYARTEAKGLSQDSDYARNDRQAEFSRSYADTTGSEMFDALLGFGWQLPVGHRFSLTPLIGLARYDSTYRASNGRQVVSDAANAALLGIPWNMPLGPFPGLHSRYNPVWSSIWQGLELEIKAGKGFSLRAGARHHWFKYKAEADWNLRGDFAHPVSFRHTGNGKGWEAEIEAGLALGGGHRLTLSAIQRDFKTRHGKDTTFFASGYNNTIELGEAVLASRAIQLGYRYDF
ncbi:hypothetical protein [uncultured Dechloromonas sp.]|uniref:hypothetical protein n=1 Tax=uncultured Dechloromonas sp. TaxID=171719 RepID=UPI0025D52B0A|nr:hypothetical protein [uncultured Dechloromonas sp.]